MSALKEKDGVWFVYDGDCPICTHAAEALRIKQEFGSLSLLNAREAVDEPLIDVIELDISPPVHDSANEINIFFLSNFL